MVANEAAENVLGTIGPWYLPPGLRTDTFSNPLLGLHRYHMLDRTTHTPDLEELSFKVYRWFVTLVSVSEAGPVRVND